VISIPLIKIYWGRRKDKDVHKPQHPHSLKILDYRRENSLGTWDQTKLPCHSKEHMFSRGKQKYINSTKIHV